jgi:hypothetical protein
MNAIRTLGAVSMATVVATLLLAPSARADDEAAHRLGDHPAIVVQRLYKAAGYDYASKFYPHPAGLRLYAEPPRDATDEASAAGMLAADTKTLPAQRGVARDAAALSKSGTRSGG